MSKVGIKRLPILEWIEGYFGIWAKKDMKKVDCALSKVYTKDFEFASHTFWPYEKITICGDFKSVFYHF